MADNPDQHIGKYVSIVLKSFGILVLLILPYMATDGYFTDKKHALSRQIENSDYTSTFYESGRLALERRLNDMYPPAGAKALSGATYDQLSHQALPNLSPKLTAICPYFPLVPLALSPLTALPPAQAFLAWQALSILALVISCIPIDRLRGSNLIGSFWLALLFLPAVHCLFVGQTALVLGLLPLTSGFYLLRKNRPLLAGFIFSITFLKPQVFLAAAFICIALLFRKEFKQLLGLAGGVVGFCVINAAFFGWNGFAAWFAGMQVVEQVYSSAKNGVVQQVIASFPRMAILATPADWLGPVKCVLLVSAIAFAAGALVAVRKAARTDKDSKLFLDYVLLVALSLVPLIAPYLFYYDLCILLVAWAATDVNQRLKLMLIAGALYINAYGIMVVAPVISKLATPWWLMLIYLEVYRRLLVLPWHTDSVQAVEAGTTEGFSA